MPAIPRKLYLSGLAALIFGGVSAWYIFSAISACQYLTPLTVLAMLAAFLISVCLRQMGRNPQRNIRLYLLVCIAVAAVTLVLDFHYVRTHRAVCTFPYRLHINHTSLPGSSQ